MKPDFAAEARELLNRLDSQQFAFTAWDLEQRVADRKIALDIIAAALEAAAERERQNAAEALKAFLTTTKTQDLIDAARAGGRDAGLEEAAKIVDFYDAQNESGPGFLADEIRALRGGKGEKVNTHIVQGRIVHYADGNAPDCLAAIITDIPESPNADDPAMCAFAQLGAPFPVGRVVYRDPNIEADIKVESSWHWPQECKRHPDPFALRGGKEKP